MCTFRNTITQQYPVFFHQKAQQDNPLKSKLIKTKPSRTQTVGTNFAQTMLFYKFGIDYASTSRPNGINCASKQNVGVSQKRKHAGASTRTLVTIKKSFLSMELQST